MSIRNAATLFAIHGETDMHLELRKLAGRARIVAGALLFLFIVGFAGTTHGAGQYVKVEYPASTVADELQVGVTYTLWIPDGVKTLRGIIVHQHGAGTTASREGSHGRLRPALASPGEEVGLRPSRAELSCAERKDRHHAGGFGVVVRSAARFGKGCFSRPSPISPPRPGIRN